MFERKANEENEEEEEGRTTDLERCRTASGNSAELTLLLIGTIRNRQKKHHLERKPNKKSVLKLDSNYRLSRVIHDF